MKKYIIILITLFFLSICYLSGCGALVTALIQALVGTKIGFVFIPVAATKQEIYGPVPGMIVLDHKPDNLPGYEPLIGAAITIEGTNTVALTDEEGKFVIENVPQGVKELTAEKDGFVSRVEEVAVSAPEEPAEMQSISILPSYGIHIVTGTPLQLYVYGKNKNNNTVEMEDIDWEMKGIYMGDTEMDESYAVIDENNLFTGTHPDESSTDDMSVHFTGSYNNLTSTTQYVFVSPGSFYLYGTVTSGGVPVEGARVQVANTPYFTTTDGDGKYILPEIPSGKYMVVNASKDNQSGASIFTSYPAGGSGEVDISLASSGDSYVYEATIGNTGFSGSDNNHFSSPIDVAFDSLGNCYVSDLENYRVQKFDKFNNYVATIGGKEGTDNDSFSICWGLTVDGKDNLYVCDDKRVQKFSSGGVYLQTFGETGVGGSDNSHFELAYDVAVDEDGNVYVTDTYNFRIQKFDVEGNYLMTIGETGVFGTDNSHFGEFIGPGFINLNINGDIFIADTSPNTRVQAFNSSGEWIHTLGETGIPGTDNDHFYYPAGIDFDEDGNIFIADIFNHRVQVFDKDFNYTGTIGVTGSSGRGDDRFNHPYGVGINPVTGKIYVVDDDNHRVQIFRSTGAGFVY